MSRTVDELKPVAKTMLYLKNQKMNAYSWIREISLDCCVDGLSIVIMFITAIL